MTEYGAAAPARGGERRSLAGRLLGGVFRPVTWAGEQLGAVPARREVWADNGRAHIEATELSDVDGVGHDVEARLRRTDGVRWAEVNAVTRRIAVAFDDGRLSVGDLVGIIEGVEEAHGLRRERAAGDGPDHPADVEPLHRAVAALVGDFAGLGLSLVGRAARAARLSPVPLEFAALLNFLESQPRLRALVERRLGRPLAEVTLALANAFAQGVADGPFGLFVDVVHRANLLRENLARRRAWCDREPEWYAAPRPGVVEPPAVEPRPAALPPGPVERFSDRAGVVSAGAFAVTLATTRDARRAAQALLAGLPKAARLGREAFAVQLARALAARGIVPMDARALRRLDRVDTVVLDAEVLSTGGPTLGDTVALDGVDAGDLDRVSAEFVAAGDVDRVRRHGGWAVGPLEDLDVSWPRGAKTRARELGRGGAGVLGVADGARLVGLASVVAELDPAAEDLAAAVRRAGHRLVVAGTRGAVAQRLGADEVVARGSRLPAAVRRLQADGAVVAVVAGRMAGGLRAADCAVGLCVDPSRPPWSAHLMCGADLDDATFVVEASAVARAVSRRSVTLATGGSALGGLLALTSPRAIGARRCLAAVNGATLAAMAAGTWSAAELARRPRPLRADPTLWHALPAAAVLERLDSSPGGLDAEEAARRHAEARRPAPNPVRRLAEPFLAELSDPLTPVLAVGAGVSALIGSVVDAALVGGLIGVNTVVGGVQRLRTDRAVDRLLHTSAPQVVVRRDGQDAAVPADDVVVGDVVLLRAGDAVPADCRVVAADGLEVDESAVTGESLPTGKTPEGSPAEELAARSSMLYEGATVTAGRGEAVVVATAPHTEAMRALAAAGGEQPDSGVQARLRSLTGKLVPLAIGAGAGVVGAGLWRGWPSEQVIGTGASLAVASVPEGLPFVTTAAQLAAARRLSARDAVVRNPRTIEALGRVDVLCFDKTGTLTEGGLRLVCVSDGLSDDDVDALGAPRRRVLAAALRATPSAAPAAGGASEAAAAGGNATDDAVLAAAEAAGVSGTDGADGWQALADLPFEAARGFHAVLGRTRAGGRLAVKGAPEHVLARCRTWRRDGAAVLLDERARRRLDDAVERLAGRGLRVLAVAGRDAGPRPDAGDGAGAAGDPTLEDDDVVDLGFDGLVALGDPVRSAAAAAVADLRRAGVEVLMVTGDHPSTAAAVAADSGILDGRRVLTGAELDRLDDAELDAVLPATSVVARVSPEQKVRIVRALQRGGRVVAMTGDGANDAASIRLADVGVALGRRGTRTAREAADVVVTDDRIETVIDALVEGRAMWGSVRDALAILVGGNLGEIGFTLGTSLLSRQAPINARQLLLVNLLTDLAPAMSVVLRPPTRRDPDELLREGPERSLGAALNRDLAIRGVATAAGATGAWLAARATGRAARARTVALVALVGSQLGQTVVVGGRSPTVLTAAGLSTAALAGVVQTPGVSHFFGCRPLGPLGWATAVGAAGLATTGAAVADRLVPPAAT